MVWPTLGSRTAKEQNRTEVSTTVMDLVVVFALFVFIWLAAWRSG